MNIPLRYGLNPHQAPAELVLPAPSPLQVLNGSPGYINMLDAIGAWRLVHELSRATATPAAASFKHTSPAGAAIARPLSDAFVAAQSLSGLDLSPVANAYARARGGDRMSSYGDAVAVSHKVNASLARLLRREVSDLIIAPDYEPEALEILKKKKGGRYLILQMDPAYAPPAVEQRTLFGMTLVQPSNDLAITRDTFANVVTGAQPIPDTVLDTLVVATIALKYTQSNSVCVAYDGQVIGMGAGQQSRIHCTRLACDKADKWFLQQHPRTLGLPVAEDMKRLDKINLVDSYLTESVAPRGEDAFTAAGLTQATDYFTPAVRDAWIGQFEGICLVSDAYIPFRDNIDRAAQSHVRYVAHTGGSVRDVDVAEAAREHGMTLVETGIRLFLH